MNVSQAIPDNTFNKHFQQAEPEHYFDLYTNWQLKFASGDYISSVSRQKVN